MKGIILTCGPFSTRTAVNTAGPLALRGLTTNQMYDNAMRALEMAGLGLIAVLPRSNVFIKKPPSQVQEETLLGLNLCTYELYVGRYGGRPPKCIRKQALLTDLVQLGHVTMEQVLNWQ